MARNSRACFKAFRFVVAFAFTPRGVETRNLPDFNLRIRTGMTLHLFRPRSIAAMGQIQHRGIQFNPGNAAFDVIARNRHHAVLLWDRCRV